MLPTRRSSSWTCNSEDGLLLPRCSPDLDPASHGLFPRPSAISLIHTVWRLGLCARSASRVLREMSHGINKPTHTI